MFIPDSHILTILEHYKYLVIFPIAVIEGPIIIVVSGFLAYLGILNIYVAFFLLVIADTVGDSLYYLIGKYWRRALWIKKIGKFLGYNEKSEEFLENHFQKHKVKTFLIAKFSHGVGSSVQVASGIARVNYFEFVLLNLLGTIPKTLILMTIGYYAGDSYIKIDGYLDSIAFIMICISLFSLLYLISRKMVRDFLAEK